MQFARDSLSALSYGAFMLALVKIALQRPLSFVVMALLILIMGGAAALRTPVDIFPQIRIPIIDAVWSYNGISPDEMAGRIVTTYERALSTTVNNVEHIESQSLNGLGIVKIYFQPGTNVAVANAQVTAISQTFLKFLPTGTTPPFILNYDASSVPVVQLGVSGEGLAEQTLFDIGNVQLRPRLSSVNGISMPFPSGGRQRAILLDLDPQALQAHGLTAQDVSNALSDQNQITPIGYAKLGVSQYNVKLNNAPDIIAEMNQLPVRTVNGAQITMGQVAHVHDGASPQTNIVHVDGKRSVIMTALKIGSASSLDVIAGVKARLPKLLENVPPALKIFVVGDQSVFIKAAVNNVLWEGALAALLTALMILLFLGSWRSTLIVILSIPLSILAAIAALSAYGETLNVMTLGGLALAVGILVDEATVTIESINYHLEQGKPIYAAIMDGAMQIVTPAFVSLLCICIVFVPMFFLSGVAGYLFVPLALAVIFAMTASFLLSRTLVPMMAHALLKPSSDRGARTERMGEGHMGNRIAKMLRAQWQACLRFFALVQQGFERRFTHFKAHYIALLHICVAKRRQFLLVFMGVVAASFVLVPFLGRDFFPQVDAGQIVMHVRTPAGTRIEETSAVFERMTARVKELIPHNELASVADNIGLPNSAINSAYLTNGTAGAQDGDMYINLSAHHAATAHYIDSIRADLNQRFPQCQLSFLPADITSQILNFGAAAPIDVQVVGSDTNKDYDVAQGLLKRIKALPSVTDVRLQQSRDYPQIKLETDRAQLANMGMTQKDVTSAVSNALAGSSQTQPVFYLNRETNATYAVYAQMPENRLGSLDALKNINVSARNGANVTLGGVANISRSNIASVVNHYSAAPLLDIYAAPWHKDLGAVSDEINVIVKDAQAKAPKGVTIVVRGQSETMGNAFYGLFWGIMLAVMLIYFIIVVNFQSWLDPLIILTALPAALAGAVWILFATHTTLSVPALTGAIMCMGVATANSILVVSFAREQMQGGTSPTEAAFAAARVRLRPVLMTALAMIIGMLPMALGIGDGGEQNAPLGRVVIGGLSFATLATLFFVPVMFGLLHERRLRNAR